MSTKLKTSSVDIVNAVREQLKETSTIDYYNRVPEATRFNLSEIGDILYRDDKLANEFLGNLVNRIAFVMVKSRLYKNPLSEFKKGELGFGVTIEEIFVQIAKAHHYNPAIAEKKVFARELPDVKSAFHTLNRQDFYKVTIYNNDLYNAFTSETGVTDMIGRIVDSLYSGDNYDEFLITKQLIAQYIDNNETYDIHVDPVVDEATAKSFLVKVRGFGRSLTFMSDKYNPMGVTTYTSLEDIVIFMTPETQAMIDVEALAGAFNMDKASIQTRIVIIDSFGESDKAKSTVGFITDRDFFVLYDKLIKFTEIYNSEGLYWNYFFHHWELMSTSKFSPVIRLTTDIINDSSIESVTIEPERDSAYPGQFVKFNSQIKGTGNYNKNLLWSVDSILSEITSQGILQINAAETEETLIVTAKSAEYPSVKGVASVTVNKYPTHSVTIANLPID